MTLSAIKEKGADAVIFGTCLYVGASAFIREFQGSLLVWGDSWVWTMWNCENTAAKPPLPPKTVIAELDISLKIYDWWHINLILK